MTHPLADRTNRIVKQRIWMFSDLQQSIPEDAKRCFDTAMQDFRTLDLPCDYIWYLGDATEGKNRDSVVEMCEMQIAGLTALNIPVRYVMGNHEFDLLRAGADGDLFPFHTAVRNVPYWKTTAQTDEFYYTEQVGDFLVAFFSDHAAADRKWHTTNGDVRGERDLYPYSKEDYEDVSKMLSASNLPVITVSHYALEGGNRASQLLSQILPLPHQAKIHFHGHAHIGDSKWAGERCHQKISWVNTQNVPQVNVSSLENRRGSSIRSVFLEMYDDRSIGVFFRDHKERRWSEIFMA
jgi:calcineurin-like phosphoesterase family protein